MTSQARSWVIRVDSRRSKVLLLSKPVYKNAAASIQMNAAAKK